MSRQFVAPRQSFLRKLVMKLTRLITLAIGLALTAALISTALVQAQHVAAGLKDVASFTPGEIGDLEPLNQRSEVYDRYGNLIATWKGEQNRVPVSLDRIPAHLIQAVLDMEDIEFYNHIGLNVKGLVRANLANVEAGTVVQGGSTITQQLVKLTILDSRQTAERKIQEAILARRLEKKFTKREILEQYLNLLYLGQGAYGVQAAAEHYFAKSVEQLSVVESAFIAGMIRNPFGYDPTRYRDRSRQRRTVVLARMAQLGHITQAEYESMRNAPMPRPVDTLSKPETYFLEAVKQSLLDDKRLGSTKSERYSSVFEGGLKIYTTFDPLAQGRAEDAIRERLPESASPEFAMALVSVDVATGAVRAMVGGPGFETYKYNLVTQGARQPGSSWKPFTLIAALEAGVSPKSTISGAEPCPIPNPMGKPDPFKPHNSSEAQGSTRSILTQLVYSNNCAYARLAWVVGYDRVASVARRLGITTGIDLVPAMSLGVEEVRPIEMAGAYATIAAGGKQRIPYTIEKVLDRRGATIFNADHGGTQVIPKDAATMATAAMRRVVEEGTGTAAGLSGREVAGKTGTTNDYEDAWFVGFTPQISTAVWMGAPAAKISMRNVGGIKVMGGTYPAQVWHEYMAAELEELPRETFITPNIDAVEKGICLSVDSIIEAQKEAERKANTALKAAKKELTRAQKALSQAQKRAVAADSKLRKANTQAATDAQKLAAATSDRARQKASDAVARSQAAAQKASADAVGAAADVTAAKSALSSAHGQVQLAQDAADKAALDGRSRSASGGGLLTGTATVAPVGFAAVGRGYSVALPLQVDPVPVANPAPDPAPPPEPVPAADPAPAPEPAATAAAEPGSDEPTTTKPRSSQGRKTTVRKRTTEAVLCSDPSYLGSLRFASPASTSDSKSSVSESENARTTKKVVRKAARKTTKRVVKRSTAVVAEPTPTPATAAEPASTPEPVPAGGAGGGQSVESPSP